MSIEFVFCESCGVSIPVPMHKTQHILCTSCRVLPRQYPDNPYTRPATLRELWGMEDEPRRRMIGEFWK